MDLDAILGDWRGAGYSETRATACAKRVQEIVDRGLVEIDEPTQFDRIALWSEALKIATHELPPELI